MHSNASTAYVKSTSALRTIDFWISLASSTLPIVIKQIAATPMADIPYKVVYALLHAIAETPPLLAVIFIFLLLIIALHTGFAWILWRIWHPLSQGLNQPAKQRVLLSTLFFTSIQVGLVAVNSQLFPNSGIRVAHPVVFMVIASISLLSVLGWYWQRWLKTTPQELPNNFYKTRFIGLTLIVLFLTAFLIPFKGYAPASHLSRQQPDIIIIGIDSLRPDHLGQPADKNTITPNLDNFLKSAYHFQRTYTPLSRTYPAWMSVLTGRYPMEHGARFNLINPNHLIDSNRSLPFFLKTHNYTTVYAIDETRFSNIDNRYGFEITLTPSIGAADFLLSEYSDLPLSNLLSLTPKLQAFLFPYQFMNRAVHKTYNPDVFDHELARTINISDSSKPLFLVTHFELPHWPYDWRSASDYKIPYNERLYKLSPPSYQKAVHRADKQFSSLMETLKQNGRLRNAIVAVISDHGEGFEKYSSSWHAVTESEKIALPPFSMHGINVLDENQTRVLLAFSRFSQFEPTLFGTNNNLTSLVDVAPSLLYLSGFNPQELKATGCNLFSEQNNQNTCKPETRLIYTETDLYVPALAASGEINQNKVAAEAYSLYEVNNDTRLTLKDNSVTYLLKQKQRAVISNQGLIAALLPESSKHLLIGDLKSNQYRIVRNSPRPDSQHQLLENFCKGYLGDDSTLDYLCLNYNQHHTKALLENK